MTEFQIWLRNWKRETPSVRHWYKRFCYYGERIDQLVTHAPFPVIGVKHTGFNYGQQTFMDEPCLRWCFENLEPNDYSEIFVVDVGSDGVHRPICSSKLFDGKILVRAIMFQTEDMAAWFKLSCIDKVCDAYAWKEL